MSFSNSLSGSSSTNDYFILMRNFRGYESKLFHDLANDVDSSVFLWRNFTKLPKKKGGGPMKGLYNFRVVIVFFLSNLNHHVNQEVSLMMDDLDPLLPESNGHDLMVVTLFVERKTCCHIAQALVFHHLRCSKLRFAIRSDNGTKFITMMMGSIPLFCFATLNPIISCSAKFQVQNC
jgi:hypothetical protein